MKVGNYRSLENSDWRRLFGNGDANALDAQSSRTPAVTITVNNLYLCAGNGSNSEVTEPDEYYVYDDEASTPE